MEYGLQQDKHSAFVSLFGIHFSLILKTTISESGKCNNCDDQKLYVKIQLPFLNPFNLSSLLPNWTFLLEYKEMQDIP